VKVNKLRNIGNNDAFKMHRERKLVLKEAMQFIVGHVNLVTNERQFRVFLLLFN
jgi:hypothetical protein